MMLSPADGATHWSTRKLGAALSISHMMVARVWAKHGLKPQRVERYMASNDVDFERKAADIIGLYLKPPTHAAGFCVDEKTAIQALDRKDPMLPLSPGRAERHGFEYYRHGTLPLYAAFNTKTGEVLGKTAQRHTSAQFVAFLADIVAHQRCSPRNRLMIAVRSTTKPCLTRCSASSACCSVLFTGTKRMLGRVTASHTASASLPSFLSLFLYGATNLGAISLTVWPCCSKRRPHSCAPEHASMPIRQGDNDATVSTSRSRRTVRRSTVLPAASTP